MLHRTLHRHRPLDALRPLCSRALQENRLNQYMNYVNRREEVERNQEQLFQACTPVCKVSAA